MEAFIPSTPLSKTRFIPPTTPPSPIRLHKPKRPNPCPITSKAHLPDVLIIGGGLAGLSTAYELSTSGASVQILTAPTRRPAGLAAAGMLAPAPERVSGPLRTLADHSLTLYPRFISSLQTHLPETDLRYISLPDYLAPHFSPVPPTLHPQATSLTASQARLLEPALSPSITSAHLFRGQAHVDNRAVMAALHAGCVQRGVEISQQHARRLVVSPDGSHLNSVVTSTGDHFRAAHYVLASGAWSGSLLPGLPVRPVKGQMLSLRVPKAEGDTGRLRHVLHGHEVYVVPKRECSEYYIGATVEEGTFELGNTAGGVAALLNAAVRLVPAFERYEIGECWAGIRPAMPDSLPVLGMSELDNLSIATGYFRNGFLIAPAAAKIAAATVLGEVDRLPTELRDVVDAFSVSRFLGRGDVQGLVDAGDGEGRDEVVKQGSSAKERKSPEGEEASKVLMWRLLPDGTKEPVTPSEQFSKMKRISSKTVVPEPKGTEETNAPSKQLSNVSAHNDAYEDVMQHRGEDEEEVMRKALAANRAYGRVKSSLEKDGSPPLSISEEEVVRFDAALQQGLEDFKDVAKTFDDNHPSTIATRAELLRISQRKKLEIQTINGTANPSFDRQIGVGDSPGSQGYY